MNGALRKQRVGRTCHCAHLLAPSPLGTPPPTCARAQFRNQHEIRYATRLAPRSYLSDKNRVMNEHV